MMKLPIWFFRSLPMWSYICPKCRKDVDKSSSVCPHCGERFGQPLRVPCKILKDKQALSKYVHEKIFPRISQAQRAYLTRFWTVFLNDGFESEDFSAWTNTQQNNATLSVSNDVAYRGSFSAKGTGLDAQGDYVMAQKTIAAQSTLYMRAYIYFTQNFNTSTELESLLHMETSTPENIAVNLERRANGSYRWVAENHIDSESFYSDEFSLSLNTWYCVELKGVIDAANGEVVVWVDGVEEINETGLDTGSDDIVEVRIEAFLDDNNSNPGTLYWDCVVVADFQISCLERTKTFTVGARLQDTFTKTFTAGARLQDTFTKTFTAGARLVHQYTKTFTVGGRIQDTFTKTFTMAAQDTFTKTFTMAAHLRHFDVGHVLEIISTNIKPSEGNARFECYHGGNVYLQNFKAGDIGSLKIWLSHLPFTLDNLHKYAEYATLGGGADVEDLADDSGTSARLNAQNEYVRWDLTGITDLPKGRYVLLVRAKDANQVADDLGMYVYNTGDSVYCNQENEEVTVTLTGSFAYYQLIFDVGDDDSEDTVRVQCTKKKADANTIYIDYFLVIPISNGSDFPQDIAHNLLRRVGQKFQLSRRA